MTRSFAHLPRWIMETLAGKCDCPGDRKACPKCALTAEVNRLYKAGVPLEKLFFVLVRLVGEVIGQSPGGEATHQMLIQSFTNVLRVAVMVVEEEQAKQQKTERP